MHTYSVETLSQLASAGSEFYRSLLCEHNRFGGLTVAQITTLTEVDVSPAASKLKVITGHLERAFRTAQERGVHQPRITLVGFYFMPADPARAKEVNRDAIFVNQQGTGTYLGKVLRGEFFPWKTCTEDIAQRVRSAMDDPYQAAVQYGHDTGRCSICNRRLDNPESVKLGIGPICRKKFGW